MAFLETPRLSELITQGAKSTTQWSRQKNYAKGGRLKQNFDWLDSKHVLDLAYRAHPPSDYFELCDIFSVVMANRLVGFRAKDWSDFTLTLTNSTLSLVTGSDYQIQRKHTFGAYSYLRSIKKPIASSIVIWRTRSDALTVAAATVDDTTGIATIVGHEDGDTYSATGEFDIPVTFVNDEWITNFQGTSADLWLSPDPILLEEIRL